MATTQTIARRRRRSTQVAPEPHVLQRRGSARFHPLSSSSFGLPENEYLVNGDSSHHGLLYYSSTPKAQRLQLQGYTIEGGWTVGPDGRTSYVEHGRIEEINDNDNDDDNEHSDDDSDDSDEDNDEDNYYYALNGDSDMTPRLQVLPSLSNPNMPADSGGVNGFGTGPIPITEPLPPSTTPPPCPRPLRRLKPLLFPSATSSVIMGPHPPSRAPLNGNARPFKDKSNMPPTQTQQQMQGRARSKRPAVLDMETEVVLLDENTDLLHTVMRDMQILQTWFFAQRPVEAFTDHIECCSAIEQSLQEIIEVLNTRRRLGEEEWSVKSTTWHEKYCERLYSLRRTLVRLLNVRLTVERRRMKPHHVELVLEKLKQHQAKLEDLADKFVSGFERIRIKHIHFLLVQAYTQARRREEARKLDEVSFEKQWYEDKNIREDLRREFYEAQQNRTRRRKEQRR